MPPPHSSTSTTAARDGKSRSGQSSSRQKGGLRSTYVFTTRPPSSKGHPTPLSQPPAYPTLFKQPFSDPLEVLCHAYNVNKLTIAIKANDDVPERVTMHVLDDAHMPTHALAILDTRRAAESKEAQSILYPLIVPIDAELFEKAFDNEIVRNYARHTQPTTARTPATSWSESTGTQVITLPTITTRVPHPPSLPLLILFGLARYLPIERIAEPPSRPLSPTSPPLSPTASLLAADHIPSPHPLHRRTRSAGSATIHTRSAHLSTGLLTTYLLPVAVIEEFPAAAAMADVMARTCSDEELAAYVAQNQGLWRNALLIAPQDSAIIEIVKTAWNVTAEARRLKDKLREDPQQQEKESQGKDQKHRSPQRTRDRGVLDDDVDDMR